MPVLHYQQPERKRIFKLLNPDPQMELTEASGILRVAVHSNTSGVWTLFILVVDLAFAAVGLVKWAEMPTLIRTVWSFSVLSTTFTLIFKSSSAEVVEIDARKISTRTEHRGWEPRLEYQVEDCSELEWDHGSENIPPGLVFKSGRRSIRIAKDISENQSIEILTALQESLPEVAQRLCSYPARKNHFITLGLSGREK